MAVTCTCPPAVDVMRGRAGDTRPECPMHPTPRGLVDMLIARFDDAWEREVLGVFAPPPPPSHFNSRTARGRARRS